MSSLRITAFTLFCLLLFSCPKSPEWGIVIQNAQIIDRTILLYMKKREPHLMSEGIKKVWVNGHLVFEDGKSTDKMAHLSQPINKTIN